MLQKIWITPNKFIGERQDETSALQGTEAAFFCLVTFLLTRQKHLHKAALHRLRHTEQPQLLVLSVPPYLGCKEDRNCSIRRAARMFPQRDITGRDRQCCFRDKSTRTTIPPPTVSPKKGKENF